MSWRASGRRSVRPPASRARRPEGSWGAALERARESFDGLTGGPPAEGRYSDAAAAAILTAALGLWADTAAALELGGD